MGYWRVSSSYYAVKSVPFVSITKPMALTSGAHIVHSPHKHNYEQVCVFPKLFPLPQLQSMLTAGATLPATCLYPLHLFSLQALLTAPLRCLASLLCLPVLLGTQLA